MSGLETTFVIIGAVGFLFVVITFVFGEIFDFAGDVVDSIGDIDVDVDTDLGHSDVPVPSFFSSRVLSASLVGFGGAGWIAADAGAATGVALVAALLGFGAVGGFTFFAVVRPLARQQFNATISSRSYAGREAVVTLTIDPPNRGQVEFVDGNGTRVRRPAMIDGDSAALRGTNVTITRSTADAVVVTPTSN